MSDVRYPGGQAGDDGFAAIRAKYGETMVQRILNWPRLAEVYATAQYADPANDVEKAKAAMERARTDRDFALGQAAGIARSFPRKEWDLVPSVAALRRDWGFGG